MLGCNWDLGFLRVFLCTIVFSLIIVKSLQLHGRRQIAEPRKFCLVRVIVFFEVCFLYLFCFSQVGILIKIPYKAVSIKEPRKHPRFEGHDSEKIASTVEASSQPSTMIMLSWNC